MKMDFTSVQLEGDILKVSIQIADARQFIKMQEEYLVKLEEKYKKHNWMNGSDEQVFGEVRLESNHTNWKVVKKEYKKSVSIGAFYIGLDDSVDWDGLTVLQAKKLVKYITDKINYLESEEE